MTEIAQPLIATKEADEAYAHFTVEPLEKGFGTTIGNALRRVLLSSLIGAAVTQVRIEGVQHEFSPLPGAKEDTMNFLLNLKGLRLKPLSGHPGRLVLDVKGARQVTAGDIAKSSDFEVANPDLYLATLDNADSHLYVEMEVEIGRGFVEAAAADNAAIGTIPQDAIFSPVEKVNYEIEPVHMGQEMSYERLHMRIWMDGTMSPADAISQSAGVLVSHFQPFTEIGAPALKISNTPPVKLAIPEEKFNMPIEQLDLSVRSLNCLRHAGLNTVGELLSKGIDELMGLRNFGLKSLNELEERLQAFDLSFNAPEGLLSGVVEEVEEETKKPRRKRADAAAE
ncbi:MAG: DNA-directed RNA polymerase subunit alpha [Dehalogenimonas sp.]|uniref:DNA-directed RNA polymerase subunit alpha n=1 Tax=Candidatus Dehalogenimonas loeffleri TaxID=3127115 RepID=A0ABZ2J7T1_9CHLR|nr:DNA-directed RNA polymerase subunit alpha [Dehalogenimonas sp.]